MPSFIIRDIPEDFWIKVKTKAASEGVTVKKFVYEALSDRLKIVRRP